MKTLSQFLSEGEIGTQAIERGREFKNRQRDKASAQKGSGTIGADSDSNKFKKSNLADKAGRSIKKVSQGVGNVIRAGIAAHRDKRERVNKGQPKNPNSPD